MAKITFIGEGGAIGAGKAVKDGTAELGVVVGTDDSANLGVAIGNVEAGESFAVGEQIGVAMLGEEVPCLAGGTVTKGMKCKSNASGTFEDVGAGSNPSVLALENAVSGEVFRGLVIANG